MKYSMNSKMLTMVQYKQVYLAPIYLPKCITATQNAIPSANQVSDIGRRLVHASIS